MLSTFFWLLTMGAYFWYAREPDKKKLLLACLFFSLGLMSKPMLVTLPVIMIALDYWPLRRISFYRVGNSSAPEAPKSGKQKKKRRNRAENIPSEPTVDPRHVPLRSILYEKMPFFILAFISSVVTIIAQKEGGAVVPIVKFSLVARLENALCSYLRYIIKMLWPSNLSIFYLDDPNPWVAALSVFVLLVITWMAIKLSKRMPYILTGWAWYLVSLLPVIGIIQVGGQSMADRFTYVPIIGLFIALIWSVSDLMKDWRFWKPLSVVAAGIILIFLTGATWVQLGYWHDSISVFEHAVAVDNNNALAHVNLGSVLEGKGNYSEAEKHFRSALDTHPNYYAYYGLANCLSRTGKISEAITYYYKALRINPQMAIAHLNLAQCLALTGKKEEAILHYSEVLKLNPAFTFAQNEIGVLLASMGRYQEAINHFQDYLRMEPRNAVGFFNLGLTYSALSKPADAAGYYREAVSINPNFAEAYNALGVAMMMEGHRIEAVAQFRKALDIKPDFPRARQNLERALNGRISQTSK